MKSRIDIDVFKDFQKLTIAVIGDSILDKYVFGEVKRTSPEAPVPILRVKSEEYILGGACNVANNLKSMGANVIYFSVVGDDNAADLLKALLLKHKIIMGCFLKNKKQKTILKTRLIAMGQQLIRIDEEEIISISKQNEYTILNKLKDNIKKISGIILSDYGKGLLSENLIQEIIHLAQKNNIKVIGDPKGRDYRKYKGIFALTPNVAETEKAIEMDINNEKDLETAGKKLLELLQSEAAVITRGAEGVAIFEKDRPMVALKAKAREVYDVTGAGDTFISHFGLGLFSGLPVDTSAEIGNYAASLVVEKVGVATITPDELSEFVLGETFKTKFVDLLSLQLITDSLKNKGKKIVFTNGCFDLIHVGHIKFLQKAKELGDVLIVAVNSDRSVRKIKGNPRPILNEIDRIHLICAIEAVDYVILFDEDEPVSLIKNIQPNILVKGKNIPLDKIVGRKIVEGYGGKVKRLPCYHGLSTNKLISEIAKGSEKK